MARRRRAAWVPPGVLVLWKPAGPTSHDLVDYVRRLSPKGAKVGHTGTLDPFAEGVLPLCLGGATRLADLVGDQPKTYRALADLSADTDTGDLTGAVTAEHPRPAGFDAEAVARAAAGLTGEIEQTPPAYSAVRVDGERAYARARRGEDVKVPSRRVTVRSWEVLRVGWPEVEFRVVCSRGTYVRSLATDLGRALGCGGHLRELTRERVGALGAAEAYTPFDLLRLPRLADGYVPLETCLPAGRRLELEAAAAARVRRGNPVSAPAGAAPGEQLILYPAGGGEPIALARWDGAGPLRPAKVFPEKGA